MSLTEKEQKDYIAIRRVFDKCDNIKQIMTYAGVNRKTVGEYLLFTGKEVKPRLLREKLKKCDQFYFEDISGKELMRKTGLPYGFIVKYITSKKSGSLSTSNRIEKFYKKGMSTARLANLSGIPYGAVYLWMMKRGFAKIYPKPKSKAEILRSKWGL